VVAVVSTTTQLAIKGIARDPSAYVAGGGGYLRRAQNAVIRAEGVAESRPNFDLLYERTDAKRLRAVVEFGGVPFGIEFDSVTDDAWTARRLTDGTLVTGGSIDDWGGRTYMFEPASWDETEPRFAEARGNLYQPTARGGAVIESPTGTPTGRYAGVENAWAVTDYQPPAQPAGTPYSYAYRFVFVRKDAGGYVRRSPPTARRVCFVTWKNGESNGTWATGTRFYFWRELVAGDQIEAYRTRTTAGLAPRPEHYLAWTYTLTSADVAAGYFVPPVDQLRDDELGAQLYTDAAQGGEVGARYRPPQSQAIAWWQRCMWWGRTREKLRVNFEIKRLFRHGLPTHARDATYTSGSDTVQVADTSDLQLGQYWTDVNGFDTGGTSAGTAVPANTTISSIVDATHFKLSANATSTGTLLSGVVDPTAPQGLITESQNGTYTAGSPNVVGLTDTSMMRAGMYWTDSATGPIAAGAKVPAETKILAITGPNSVQLTKNALASGAGVASTYGDIVTVDGVDFYACNLGTAVAVPSTPWTTPGRCFPIRTPATLAPLPDARWIAATNLANAINQWSVTHGFTADHFLWNAIPVGSSYATAASTILALGQTPGGAAVAVSVESINSGITGHDLVVSCSQSSAIDPPTPITCTDADVHRPARVWFSDLDEPESVPLANYLDIGTAAAPILALVPLTSALVVFKTDGVFRITGSGPAGWAVDCIDNALRLLRPECVATMGGVAYAWCDRGVMAVTENGAESISAGKIDNELRTYADHTLASTTTHGAFVVSWRHRALVLVGVPTVYGAAQSTRIYAWCAITQAWAEWDENWIGAAPATRDTLYVAMGNRASSAAVYEAREAVAPRGYDRAYSLDTAVSATGTVAALVLDETLILPWIPQIGDWVSAIAGGTLQSRRLTAVVYDGGAGTYTVTFEAPIVGVAEEPSPQWTAYEAVPMILEWHPTAPARLPVGAVCRELHVHLDLRDAPDATLHYSAPRYLVGGSSERDLAPHTEISAKARTATVQPLRVGASRQLARAASIAPYFETSEIYPLRVLGLSLAWAGYSERTTR